jgi:exodeoxyribonuclease VII small subunit
LENVTTGNPQGFTIFAGHFLPEAALQ